MNPAQKLMHKMAACHKNRQTIIKKNMNAQTKTAALVLVASIVKK